MRWTTLLLLCAVGCGSSPSKNFIGTWTYSTGAVNTITCTGGTSSVMLTGNLTLVAGTSSDLVATDQGGCNTKWTVVNGTQATLVPGQSCAGPSGTDANTGQAITSTLNFNTGTLTTPDSKNMTVNLGGSATLMEAGFQPSTCTTTINAALTKVGQ